MHNGPTHNVITCFAGSPLHAPHRPPTAHTTPRPGPGGPPEMFDEIDERGVPDWKLAQIYEDVEKVGYAREAERIHEIRSAIQRYHNETSGRLSKGQRKKLNAQRRKLGLLPPLPARLEAAPPLHGTPTPRPVVPAAIHPAPAPASPDQQQRVDEFTVAFLEYMHR